MKFNWSNLNRLDNGRWATFYYCPGMGFETGSKVYYGRNEWNTIESATKSQTEWEARWQPKN